MAIKKNVASQKVFFLMVDATDFATPEPSLSPTGKWWKDGSGLSSLSNTVSECTSGLYRVTLKQAETNQDVLKFQFTAAGAADQWLILYTEDYPTQFSDILSTLDQQFSDILSTLDQQSSDIISTLDGNVASSLSNITSIVTLAGGRISSILTDTGTTLDDKIDSILADTNTIVPKLPTNYIMGSPDAADKLTVLYQTYTPESIDLANTAVITPAIQIYTNRGSLPTGAEITPGTITISRKAKGATTWTNIVATAACSEADGGFVYYDEVFDAATGYAEGDSIRFTFYNQAVVINGVTYNLVGANGIRTWSNIRETIVPKIDSILEDTKTTLDDKIDSILEDTKTTIPGTISDLQSGFDSNVSNTLSILTLNGNKITSILTDTGTTLDDKIDSILIDTNSTLDNKIDSILADVKSILVDSGSTLSNKITSILADTTSIIIDTGSTLANQLISILADTTSILIDTNSTLDNKIDSILSDTKSILSTIDGSVTSSLSNIESAVALISGDSNKITSILEDTKTTLPSILSNILSTVDGPVLSNLSNIESIVALLGGDSAKITSILADTQSIIEDLSEMKGATFDQTTDSLEAIRNRGDVAWLTGGGTGGASTVTITVQLSGGTPIQDCSVQIWNTGLTALVSYASTNSSGQVTLSADDGSYKVKLRKGGYGFTDPESLTVAGTTSATYTGTSVNPSAPASVASCRIYDYAFMPDGATPVSSLIAIAKIVSLPEDLNNVLHTGEEVQATYDSSNGLFYWDIVKGAVVEFEVNEFGLRKSATVPSSVTVRLSSL